MRTKECCYEGVDRTILIDMKKIFDVLQKRRKTSMLSTTEEITYFYLKEVLENLINREFLQGGNRFTYMSDLDKSTYIGAISNLQTYLSLNSKSDDVEAKNLMFRISLILKDNKNIEIKNMEADNEFSNGKPVDLNSLTPDDYKKAAYEFSEGSKAMEDLFIYCFETDFPTFASCAGHECKNGSIDSGYITVKLDGTCDEKKMFLISRAYEAGIEVAFIKNSKGEILMNMLLNPYEREEQVSKIKGFLENFKGDIQMNPTLENILNYVKENDVRSVCIGKADEGVVLLSEIGKTSGVISGFFEEQEISELYKENKVINLNTNRLFLPDDLSHVNASDIARSVLTLTKTLPGKFADSMKRTWHIVKEMFNPVRAKENER